MDSSPYGARSVRRTKAAQIYRKAGNLRAVQLLLGHTKIQSAIRYVDNALTLSEHVEPERQRGLARCVAHAPQGVVPTIRTLDAELTFRLAP